jgi:hypothetical protein
VAAPTEPIRIDYRAEAGCPSADDFNAQVFRRTASARLASPNDTARTFIVVIERRGAGLVGSLVVQQADGTTESREVAGPKCREVATVLALATALAIDPQASLAPATETETGTRSGGTSEPDGPLADPPPLAPPLAEPGRVAEQPDDGEADELPDPSGGRVSGPWSIALGPTLEGGVTPRLAYGGSAGFGWRSTGGRGAVSALELELTFLHSPSSSSGRATSSFQLLYARPALCSLALRWDSVSGVAPCLGAELGVITGSGENVPFAWTRSRLWATLDMGMRLHQALGVAWFLEVDANVVLPVTRYEFVFRDPTTRLFSVPSAAGAGGLRVGVRL